MSPKMHNIPGEPNKASHVSQITNQPPRKRVPDSPRGDADTFNKRFKFSPSVCDTYRYIKDEDGGIHDEVDAPDKESTTLNEETIVIQDLVDTKQKETIITNDLADTIPLNKKTIVIQDLASDTKALNEETEVTHDLTNTTLINEESQAINYVADTKHKETVPAHDLSDPIHLNKEPIIARNLPDPRHKETIAIRDLPDPKIPNEEPILTRNLPDPTQINKETALNLNQIERFGQGSVLKHLINPALYEREITLGSNDRKGSTNTNQNKDEQVVDDVIDGSGSEVWKNWESMSHMFKRNRTATPNARVRENSPIFEIVSGSRWFEDKNIRDLKKQQLVDKASPLEIRQSPKKKHNGGLFR